MVRPSGLEGRSSTGWMPPVSSADEVGISPWLQVPVCVLEVEFAFPGAPSNTARVLLRPGLSLIYISQLPPLLLRLGSPLPGCTHPPLALGLFANCPGQCCQPRRALGCVPGVWLCLCRSVPDCHEPGPPWSAPAVAWFRRKLQDYLKHVGLQ